MRKIRDAGFGLVLGAAMLLSSTPASAQQRVEEIRPARPDGSVRIYNLAGTVRVSAWDRAEVSVRGTLERDVERLDFTSEGGVVEIEVVLPESRGRRGRIEGSADLEIRVPAGSRLNARTISADVSVRDVTGEIGLDTVSGSIDVIGEAGVVSAESISGDIVIQTATTSLRAATVSGKVVVRQVPPRFEISAISGSLSASGRGITDGRMESMSGNIDFEGDLQGQATLAAESHSGTVGLRLPADVSARFRVTSFSGNIRNGFGQEARRSSRYGPGWELDFTNGSGAARITVRSFSGTVSIEKY